MDLRKLIHQIISEGQFDLDPKYFLQGSYHKDFPDFFDPIFNQSFKDHSYPPALGVTLNPAPLNEDGPEDEKNMADFTARTNKLVDKFKAMGAKVEVSFNNYQSMHLSTLIIPEELRGQGLAKSFMNDLTALADKYNVIITLSPSNSFGSSVTMLRRFYKTFGFRENKGRYADHRFWASMIRDPK